MSNFYISVSNGLLKDNHQKRMGAAVWQFLWCLDKVTKIDQEGVGIVLGGKPVQLKDIIGGHRVTVSRNLTHLEKEGYLKLTHTPYGIIIKVMKMKKRFNRIAKPDDEKSVSENVKPELERINNNAKPTLTKTLKPRNKNVKPVYENAKPNKTLSVDSTVDNTTKTIAKVPEGTLRGEEWQEILDAFEPVNKFYVRFYKNKTQRQAIMDILKKSTKQQLLSVIKLLPQTNRKNFFPHIDTPIQLRDKWSALEDAFVRYKQKGADSVRVDTQTVDKFPTK